MIGKKIPIKLRMPWAGHPPDKQIEISREFMRRFLRTDDGRVFFTLFLKDHYFFDQPKTPEEQALRNYATFFIKERLGLQDQIEMANALLDSTP